MTWTASSQPDVYVLGLLRDRPRPWRGVQEIDPVDVRVPPRVLELVTRSAAPPAV